MSDDTTMIPRPVGRPPGRKYPAALPRTMTTDRQREAVEAYADRHADKLGETVRELLDHGLTLGETFDLDPDLTHDVDRLAAGSGKGRAEAIAIMLRFAVHESDRRLDRDRKLAAGLAESLARDGVPFDGVSVGTVEISLDR